MGFQVGRLTVTALVTVSHQWFKVLECRQDACSVFFDLKNQKHFDSVPYQPLMDKLHSYGYDLNTLACMHIYITNRKQHDVVDGSASSDNACSFWSTSRLCAGTPSFPYLYILTTFQLLVSQKGLPQCLC